MTRLAVALLALAVAACQLTLTLDNERLEQVIKDGVAQQTGVTLTDVSCPDDRPLKQGDEFTCSATAADGAAVVISVTQTDDKGNVNWQVTEP
jgi:hypothetical protein